MAFKAADFAKEKDDTSALHVHISKMNKKSKIPQPYSADFGS